MDNKNTTAFPTPRPVNEMSPNGSRLGEVGDFEKQTLKLLLNLN